MYMSCVVHQQLLRPRFINHVHFRKCASNVKPAASPRSAAEELQKLMPRVLQKRSWKWWAVAYTTFMISDVALVLILSDIYPRVRMLCEYSSPIVTLPLFGAFLGPKAGDQHLCNAMKRRFGLNAKSSIVGSARTTGPSETFEQLASRLKAQSVQRNNDEEEFTVGEA